MEAETEMTAAIEALLTREEAADILGMSLSWVKKEIRKGRLRATKMGTRVRIEPQDLRDFIFENRSRVGKNGGTPTIPGLFAADTEKTQMFGRTRG